VKIAFLSTADSVRFVELHSILGHKPVKKNSLKIHRATKFSIRKYFSQANQSECEESPRGRKSIKSSICSSSTPELDAMEIEANESQLLRESESDRDAKKAFTWLSRGTCNHEEETLNQYCTSCGSGIVDYLLS
jgi:hypothetical protein